MCRLVSIIVLALCALCVLAAPGPDAWFDLFGVGFNQQPRSYQPRQPSRAASPRAVGGKERYKQICRTINPDNYAFPGRIPYPSSPVCPY